LWGEIEPSKGKYNTFIVKLEWLEEEEGKSEGKKCDYSI